MQRSRSLLRLGLSAGLALGLALAGQLVLLPAAQAATVLTVSTTADVSADTGACGDVGITTAPSPLSLREAACLADNLGGDVAINVPAGVYTLTNGELRLGRGPGQNVTLTGAGAGSTVIDAGGLNRVLELDYNLTGGIASTISGVTLRGGSDGTYGGGGIIAGSGTSADLDDLTISNSTITANQTDPAGSNLPGGGVQFVGGSLSIVNSTISNNSSGSSPGSGIFYQGLGIVGGEHLSVSGSTFSGNNADAASLVNGGALAAAGASYDVSGTRFVNNIVTGSSARGAAIWSESGALTVTGSTFTGNSAATGGAVAVDGGSATLHYNRFTGNIGASGSAVSSGVGTGVNATENWWGCNTGPGTTGCDTVAGGPTVSPRLMLTGSATPADVIGRMMSSTVTATLTKDSAGAAVDPAQLGAFAGLPVSWTDPQPAGAGVTPASANLSAGSATTTYSCSAACGAGHVIAALDQASVTVVIPQAPVVTLNPADQTVPPGNPVTFTAAASGVPTPTVQWQLSTDGGISFTDIAGATSTSYTFAVVAADNGNRYRAVFSNGVGSPAATTAATLRASSPPAFTSPATATFVIGSAGSFSVTTSGIPTVSTIAESGSLPAGVAFTDNGNGTATIAGTPTGTGNTYPVTLTASNGISPNASQNLSIQVNQASAVTLNPVDQTVPPGSSVSFTAAASGVPTPTVQWQVSTDGGASFTNITGANSTTYTLSAALGDDGNQYQAVFSNGVGSPAVTAAAMLRVGSAPSFTSADHTSFVVGQAGSFTITTTGVPSAILSRTGVQFPAWLTLTDHGDGTGALTGTPPAGSGGTYQFTLKANNGFSPSASQTFTLFVDDSPVITSADHTTFTAGQAGSFAVTTTAGFPTTTALSETGSLPSGVRFVDNGDGTATLSGTVAAGAGGPYPLTITATAVGGLAAPATQSFTLTVNAPPVITSANHTTFAVGNAGSFTVTTTAGHPAATTLSKTGTLPAGVSFTDNGNGTASIAGTPNAGSGGVYPITITASNGVAPDATQAFTLTVNTPPQITSANHVTFTKGVAAAFTVTTTGSPKSALSETDSLPPGITFTDNGDGTATLGGTPSTSGSFTFTITASNGVLPNATQSFTATVNAPPAITSADHTTFTVGTAGSFTVTTSPGTPATITLTETGSLPSGVTFTDNGNGTATLAGTPAAGSGGSYALTITASNGVPPNGTQSFTLTVTELPAFTSANHAAFTVGSAGSFTVTSRSGFPTATSITETGPLPSGITFTDNGDGTAVLAGTAAAGTGGSYSVTLSAINAAGHTDQAFTLTVSQSPVITSANHATFTVGTAGTFTVTTSGGYPATPALTESGALPSGVTFQDNGNGAAKLSGTPTVGGVFAITLMANNGVAPVTTQSFTLTVNGPPSFTSPNTITFLSGTNTNCETFLVSTEATGSPVMTVISQSGMLPSGLTFRDNGDGTAFLSGCPSGYGTYSLTFAVTNQVGSAQQAFTLKVQMTSASWVPLPATVPPSNGTLQGVTQTTPGQVLNVSGGGYAPSVPIIIGYYLGPATPTNTSGPVTLMNVVTSTAGTFTATITMSKVGSRTLVASGGGSNNTARYLEAISDTENATT